MRNPSSCFVSWRKSGATNLMWGPEAERGAGVEEQKVERTGGEAGRRGGGEAGRRGGREAGRWSRSQK